MFGVYTYEHANHTCVFILKSLVVFFVIAGLWSGRSLLQNLSQEVICTTVA